MSPVIDHPVHEKTRIKAGYKYGCYDRKGMSVGYIAPDRQYRPDGTFIVTQKFISHVLSETCKYDMSDKDKFCEGCEAKKDPVFQAGSNTQGACCVNFILILY